ncbi:MAG: hypothetical protein ABI663_24550 [Chryseolinea sp.]
MEINQETIGRLTKLREKKKFTNSDWEKRGLNPSDSDKVDEMIRLTDTCLDEILTDLKSNATEKQIRKTLTKGLKRFKTSHYDTEEKEFIGDEFHSIGSILGLDIAENLNDWLYGKVLGTIIGLTKKKEIVLDTKSFECTKCKLSLNIKVMSVEEGIPNSWFIAQCNQCGEYNLLSAEENVTEIRFENFTSIENFYGDNNTEEYAKTRLEQIRYFKGRG